MANTAAATAPQPHEIAGWICEWQHEPGRLELALRRQDRRSALVGEVLAGRIVLSRSAHGWSVEARLWVLEDLAEHQRLRVRRGSATTPDELRELLTEFGLPEEVAQRLTEARPSGDATT
jgi:hypothetical protein